ncbi:MAG: AI-2E family transporter [Methylocella sp.]
MTKLEPGARQRLVPRVPGQEPLEAVSARTTTAVLVAIAVFIYLVRLILLPFVIAGAVAYIGTAAVEWMTARFGMRRLAAEVAVYLVVLVLVAVIGFLAVPAFVQEAAQIATNLNGIIETTARRVVGDGTVHILGQSMNATQIGQWSADATRGWLKENGAQVASFGFVGVFGTFLTLVLLFYFLVGGHRLAAGLLWLVPPKQRPLVQSMWAQLDPVLKRYFIGIAVVVTYAMIAAYIGLGLVLGLHHAVLLAVLTGLLEMIPVIGPATSAVVAGLVAISDAISIWSIVAYAIYATALRLSIDQLVGPVVLGHAAAVPPALIIFCFLTGGLLFGIPGVILAVPLALTIRIVLATLYEEPLEEADGNEDVPA